MNKTSALTVRFTPDMRKKLELVAEREHRPVANQVVHFVSIGIKNYIAENKLYLSDNNPDGELEFVQYVNDENYPDPRDPNISLL